MKPVVLLMSGVGLFWGLLVVPAQYFLQGEWTYLYSGTAALLCLVPAIVTLLWIRWSTKTDPQQMPIVVLGATGIRLFGVLLAAFLLLQSVPVFRQEPGFLYWLIVFYLFTLALEMYLLVSGHSQTNGSV